MAVPALATLTDRVDGRWIVAGSSLLAASASLAFARCADGVYAALVLRLLSGVALAGVHMPGLKLLAERTASRGRARGSARYSACYTFGAVGAAYGWRSAFVGSGLVPLVGTGAVALLRAQRKSSRTQPSRSTCGRCCVTAL